MARCSWTCHGTKEQPRSVVSGGSCGDTRGLWRRTRTERKKKKEKKEEEKTEGLITSTSQEGEDAMQAKASLQEGVQCEADNLVAA